MRIDLRKGFGEYGLSHLTEQFEQIFTTDSICKCSDPKLSIYELW